MRIFSSIGAEIHPYDLDIARRVPFRNASDGRPKPIICKFTRRIARDRVMASRREVTRINLADIGLRENSSLDRAAIYDQGKISFLILLGQELHHLAEEK